MLNKKLLGDYLSTNSSDLQTLPTGINDTSIQSQQRFVSPTQSTIVPQHQYASAPNDTSRILLINTSPPKNFKQPFNHDKPIVVNNKSKSTTDKKPPSKIPMRICKL